MDTPDIVPLPAPSPLRRSGRAKSRAVGLLAVALATLPGCANRIDEQLKSCPCATGYFCCDTGYCAPDQTSCESTSNALFEMNRGEWVGHLENFSFASGSDAIRISVALSDDHQASARIVFGNETPPADPQITDVFWPPTLSSDALVQSMTSALEGVTYTAHDLRWEQRRLRFAVVGPEAWEPYCQLQTSFPVPEPAGTYRCVPSIILYDSEDTCHLEGSTAPLDCRRALMCQSTPGICACDATGCHAQSWESWFDIALRGDRGDGSTNISEFREPVANVRLRRE
jgi:hypothetical protein